MSRNRRITQVADRCMAQSAVLSPALPDGEALRGANSLAEQDRFDAMVREIEQLRRALETRDIIGQAKGMLMERFDIDAAAAFGLLKNLSQQSNTPVAVIAQKVIEIDHPGT